MVPALCVHDLGHQGVPCLQSFRSEVHLIFLASEEYHNNSASAFNLSYLSLSVKNTLLGNAAMVVFLRCGEGTGSIKSSVQSAWEPEHGPITPESPTHKQEAWCPGNQGPPPPRSQAGQRQEPQSPTHRTAHKGQQQAADRRTRQRTGHEKSRGQPDPKPARDHTPHRQKGETPRPRDPETPRNRTGRPHPPHRQPGPHEPTPLPRRARRGQPPATPPKPAAAGPPRHRATGTTHPTRRDPNDGDGTTSNRPAEPPPLREGKN
nr:serine/arginine repetitive matrix protein 1-like isoform X1 [Nerophis lumbriciformis]